MTIYTFWDKKTTLYPPSGSKMTPEQIIAEYGWAENPACRVVVGINGNIWGSIYDLEVLKGVYNITEEDPEKALALINEAANAPQPEPEPSAEERIAAALEFQNLLSM